MGLNYVVFVIMQLRRIKLNLEEREDKQSQQTLTLGIASTQETLVPFSTQH